jgi:hypothetical protein
MALKLLEPQCPALVNPEISLLLLVIEAPLGTQYTRTQQPVVLLSFLKLALAIVEVVVVEQGVFADQRGGASELGFPVFNLFEFFMDACIEFIPSRLEFYNEINGYNCSGNASSFAELTTTYMKCLFVQRHCYKARRWPTQLISAFVNSPAHLFVMEPAYGLHLCHLAGVESIDHESYL